MQTRHARLKRALFAEQALVFGVFQASGGKRETRDISRYKREGLPCALAFLRSISKPCLPGKKRGLISLIQFVYARFALHMTGKRLCTWSRCLGSLKKLVPATYDEWEALSLVSVNAI